MSLRELGLVILGGASGSVARHLSNQFLISFCGDRFPWGTLFVNVLGCFLLGWLLHADNPAHSHVKLALGTGFLGAFTTFSTFGLQTHQLWERSGWLASANIAANLLLGLLAAGLGLYVASKS